MKKEKVRAGSWVKQRPWSISACNCLIPSWEAIPISSLPQICTNAKCTPPKNHYFSSSLSLSISLSLLWLFLGFFFFFFYLSLVIYRGNLPAKKYTTTKKKKTWEREREREVNKGGPTRQSPHFHSLPRNWSSLSLSLSLCEINW